MQMRISHEDESLILAQVETGEAATQQPELPQVAQETPIDGGILTMLSVCGALAIVGTLGRGVRKDWKAAKSPRHK